MPTYLGIMVYMAMHGRMLFVKRNEGREFKVPMTIGFINRSHGFELPVKRVFKYTNDDWDLHGINQGWTLSFLGGVNKDWSLDFLVCFTSLHVMPNQLYA